MKLKQITGSDNNLPNQTPVQRQSGSRLPVQRRKRSWISSYEQGFAHPRRPFPWYQTSPKRWLDLVGNKPCRRNSALKLAVSNLLAQNRWENEVYRAQAKLWRLEQLAQPPVGAVQIEQRF